MSDDRAAILRALLDAIDAGEIDAEPVQRAYLQGAADALAGDRSNLVDEHES